MSTYEKKHDKALLSIPWLVKRTDDGAWLCKYAPHPDRAGYVFIATDLETVLFESLTAPSIPARLSDLQSESRGSQSQSQSLKRGGGSQRNVRSVVEQAESLLDELGGVMVAGEEWEGVEMQIEADRFFDKVFKIQHDTLVWSFNTTELRPRESLAFISSYLVLPLSRSLATSKGLDVSEGSAVGVLADLLDDQDVAKSIFGKGDVSRKGAKQKTKAPRVHKARIDSPEPDTELPDKAYNSEPAGDEEQETSVDEGRAADAAESTPPADDPPEPPSAQRPKHHSSSPSPPSSPIPTRSNRSRAKATPPKVSSPKSPSKSTKRIPAQPKKPPTDSPMKPTPSQGSQKTKREREKEEEEMMEKRMEEMRRKMETGGGGRLGKRRLAR